MKLVKDTGVALKDVLANIMETLTSLTVLWTEILVNPNNEVVHSVHY